MKRLDELGISPAPWRIGEVECDGIVEDIMDSGFGDESITGLVVYDGCMDKADACLIAAAPELYEAGQKTEAVLTGLFKLDEFAALLKSGAADALIACRDELRKAISKASGEAK